MLWFKKQQVINTETDNRTENEKLYGSARTTYEVSQIMWDKNPWARGVIKYYITFTKDIRQWKDEQAEIESSEN